MKNLKYYKILLFVGCCFYSCNSFAVSEATNQLIHKTLAKYGISAGGKEVCGKGKEPEYNKDNGIVKCKNDSIDDRNNCWDKESRLCKECPNGMVVSQRDYITCRQLKCPKGWKLVKVIDGKCPKGFKKKDINNSCQTGFKAYTEQTATNNYSTEFVNCKNVNKEEK